MRAILLGRPNAHAVPGGDALQIEETATVLRSAGVEVLLPRTADEARAQLRAGDTLNLWNVQRAPDWADLPERARAVGARLLITPLFHPVERYHAEGRHGVASVARMLLDADRFAALRFGGKDLLARAAEVLSAADAVLLAHPDEESLLRAWCGAELRATAVVPPAIPAIPAATVERPFEGDFVLSVGRIEPLKNPLLSLSAARRAKLPIAFVGSLPPLGKHLLHSRRFKREIGAAGRRHARWLGSMSASAVRGLMEQARVHVLASWTEVLGRSTVEAALHGAAVVLSDVGHAPAYLGSDPRVVTVDPGDEAALERGLRAAWRVGRAEDSPVAARVRETLTWPAVAPALLAAWSVG